MLDDHSLDFQRQVIEILRLQQSQIDSLGKQIQIITARSQEELNKVIGEKVAAPKKAKDIAENRMKEPLSPSEALKVLHNMALGKPEVPMYSPGIIDNTKEEE